MSIYLRKRDADHPFWPYAEGNRDVRFGLRQLADGNCRPTNLEYAGIVWNELRVDYEADNMPIAVVDSDGQPVELT